MTCAEQCKLETIFCYRLLHLGAAVQWCSFVRFVSESFLVLSAVRTICICQQPVSAALRPGRLLQGLCSHFSVCPFCPSPGCENAPESESAPTVRILRPGSSCLTKIRWPKTQEAQDACQQQHEAAHPVIRADGVRAARFWRLRAPRSRSQLRPESLSSWQQLQVVAVPGSSFSDPQNQGRPRTSGLMCLKQLVPSLPQPLQSCSREALHRPQAVMAVVAASGAHADVGCLAAA